MNRPKTANGSVVPLPVGVKFAVAVVALSFAAPLSKATKLDAVQVAAWRGLLGGSILSTFAVTQARVRRIPIRWTTSAIFAATVSGVWFLLFIAFWTASFAYISVGVSVVIVSSSVFLTFLVTSINSRWFDPLAGLGCILALLAVVPALVGEHGQRSPDLWKGAGLAALGALFGTAYYLSLARSPDRLLGPILHWAVASLTAGLLGASWSILHDGLLRGLTPHVVGLLVVLAIVPHTLGQGLLVGVASEGRPVLGNMAVVGESVGAAIIAAFWFGERITASLLVGIGLFVVGAVLIGRSKAHL